METKHYLCKEDYEIFKPRARFSIKYMEEAVQFILSLDEQARVKITYNIGKCIYGIDGNLFKKLEGSNIWEFRTLYKGIQYRLFAFWDKDEETIIIVTHGIIKKTQKTPGKEIKKAEAIRAEYFKNK